MEYKVIFNEAEDMAMRSVSYSVDDWIQNACHQRAKQAIDVIVNRSLSKFFTAGIQVPSSKEQIVLDAFKYGWEQTAAQVHDEFLANTAIFLESISANTYS